MGKVGSTCEEYEDDEAGIVGRLVVGKAGSVGEEYEDKEDGIVG